MKADIFLYKDKKSTLFMANVIEQVIGLRKKKREIET